MKKNVKNFFVLLLINAFLATGCVGKDGADGIDGRDGKDGVTPTISINEEGYWVINGKVTSVRAQGQDGLNGTNGKDGVDGADGETSTISINEEGYWVINGKVTSIKAQGQDGLNGVNGKDGTDGEDGIDGRDGKDGVTPTISINEEGYWVINGEVTTVKALGQDGIIQTDSMVVGSYLSAVDVVLSNNTIKNSTYPILSNGNVCIGTLDNNICDEELTIDANVEKPIGGKITVVDGSLLDYQATYKNKAIVSIDDEATTVYKEDNIEVPDLYNGALTPVIYKGNNWIVANPNEKWYSYKDQEWANAVILRDSVEKNVGDAVSVDGTNPDALAMLVWIPKYEYKIQGAFGKGAPNAILPGEIEVNFINTNKTTASEGYIIHPAFSFGEREISGIWVGKFELSHTTKIVNSLGCETENCEEGNNLRTLPNVKPLRNNTIASFFYGIRSMSKSNNVFGIDKNITDTHMIKNSEWGAVAYLSQSRFGRYGNHAYYEKNKEIYQNKSNLYITGNSNGTPPQTTANTQCQYNDMLNNCGIGASTTGNIYGIYDMSGGSWEYTMAVFADSMGAKWAGSSGFIGNAEENVIGLEWPNEKYYNVYKEIDNTMDSSTACNGEVCKGQIFGETVTWYQNATNFVTKTNPWQKNGGSIGATSSGAFSISYATGAAVGDMSTRVVFSSAT